ncbi:aspartate aminotransferase family protein, partial [Chloroflexota bacterium]
ELDILVWAPNAQRASVISKLSRDVFELAASRHLHLATFNYPTRLLENSWSDVVFDQEQVTCLRSCLMKPEHLEWVDSIWEILDDVMNQISTQP